MINRLVKPVAGGHRSKWSLNNIVLLLSSYYLQRGNGIKATLPAHKRMDVVKVFSLTKEWMTKFAGSDSHVASFGWTILLNN
jgi:hypothetical protein